MIDKDKMIQLAKEAAGVADAVLPTEPDPQVLEWLERFAQAIYRQGLEDAAKLADHHGDYWSGQSAVVLHRCADAIRSLKESAT